MAGLCMVGIKAGVFLLDLLSRKATHHSRAGRVGGCGYGRTCTLAPRRREERAAAPRRVRAPGRQITTNIHSHANHGTRL